MQTTNKSINEQIEEVHKLFDQDFFQAMAVDAEIKSHAQTLQTLHHHLKVIIQHIMKLEAKAYYMNKKLDQALGLAPKTDLK